jgi:uncharacterized protein (DUF1810 family)
MRDLQRFVDAQAKSYATALAELRAGEKRSHWMWYVFPQIAGLGHSHMAREYALDSLEEARAYLAHPVLGARLRECIDAMSRLPAPATAERVLGGIDAMKLRSSLTLFARAAPDEARFADALARWFDGTYDAATDARL